MKLQHPLLAPAPTRSTATQPREDIPMKFHLTRRFLVSTGAALALSLAALPTFAQTAQHTPTTSQSTQAAPARHGIGLAPAGLVAAIARTQAGAAAHNPAYAIGRNGCAVLPTGAHSSSGFSGCFGRHGPAFSAGRDKLSLHLTAWGRVGTLRPVQLVRSAPHANRIAYRGRHISEWWRVLPLGYEQGFTIDKAPAGRGKVILQLSAGAAPTVHHGTLAWGRLRYGKLRVVDATGKVLPATLRSRGTTLTLAFDAAHARYPVTVDPLVWVQQEVTAADGAAGDNFGSSVALSANGTTALVGAPTKTVGGNSGQGAAYVYTLAGGTWSQAAELTVSLGAAQDGFGDSVALSANGATALVGADYKNVGSNYGQGAAYVFTTTNNWSTNTPAELTTTLGATGDHFGNSVALSANGTIALVGADYKTVGGNSYRGAAYVFTLTAGTWSQTAELTATDGAANDYFGFSVALSADGATALVGAWEKNVSGNSQRGAAYVFTTTNNWSTNAQVELIAANGAAQDYFGISVALSGDGATALVGAYNTTVGNNSGQGAAYLFTTTNNWSTNTPAELIASDGAVNDGFGISVALSANGTTALVGAGDKTVGSNSYRGTAYVYTELPSGWVTTWTYTAELTASDGAAQDSFGSSVALSADGATALVGAYNKTIGGNSSQGAAYFFGTSDLSAGLSAPATVVPGGRFDSQYILTNNSSSASADVQVALPAPSSGADVVAVSSTGPNGVFGCTQNSITQYVTCDLGSIAGNGGTGSATLTLQATGAGGSSIAQSGQLANGAPDLVQTASTTIVVPPAPPTLSGLSNVTVTVPNAGSEAFTLAGSGTPLTVTATSSNTTLLPDANITGASSCTAAGSCTLTLTPVSGQSGSTTVTVTVTDAYNQSATGTFTFTVQLSPVANNLSLTTYENSAISTTLSASAPYGDTLSYASVTQPTHGAVTVNATTGAFTYTPTSGYSGTDSFTFTAKDTVTGLTSNTATVAITVNPTPPPGQVAPVASNLTLTTYAGQALSGTLPAVVTPSSDTLSYALVAQPTNGTVTVSATTGAFTYTPTSGYSGSDSFTFTAKDTVTGLTSNTATVAITINATPPPGQVPPVASNLTLTTYAGQALSGTLPAVVTPSSDTLSYASASQPAHGTLTVNATTGAFTYTPTSGYSGTDSFTFTAKDTVTGLTSNTATVAITVKKAPPAPPSSGGGGGGGAFGPFALLGLLLLALVPWWLRRRGSTSTSIHPREDIPMKFHLTRRFLVSTGAALALSLAALPALATPGDVDPAFNGGTPVVFDFTPTATFNPNAAAMNPLNHDILWAGHFQTPTSEGGAINVYKPDGSLDTAVGSGSGETALTAAQAGFTGGNLYLYAIDVDDQGRILAAGMLVNTYGAPAMILVRFKPDGSLDTSFGTAGTGIVVDPLHNYASASGLSLTADGHILVTGSAMDSGTVQLTVWRFNPDGTADTAFGGTGYVQIAAINDSAYEFCLPALQPDGALIAGCQLSATGGWKLTRLKADGTVDTGFGSTGFITGATSQLLAGLALAPDGGFVISELDESGSPPYPVDMRRFLADGTVDTGFNSGKPVAFGSASNGTWQVPVAVQPDGKILISANNGKNSLPIGRFLADGTADLNFAGGGSVSFIDFSNINSYNYTPTPTALLLQGDGRIVASGWADSTQGSGEAGFVTRVLSDTYDLTPTAPAFTAVLRAPLGQALASNAVAVSGVSIGGGSSGVNIALVTQTAKYSTSGGAPFAGTFIGTNVAWAHAENPLALEQMTPPSSGTDTTTTVVLGGFWAANNYEVPLGSTVTASWKTTTDVPPVASDGTLSATTAKATAGTLSATNPSSGTLAFAIVTPPAHGAVTLTNAVTGAYTYTSTGGYTGADAFTWKVNDGVADSNIATVAITVKKAPPAPPSGGGGGGSLGIIGLLALALLGFGVMFRKRREF